MRPINIMSGTTGLNTVSDPVRIPFDPKTGISDLAVAVNITIDESLRPSLRPGYKRTLEGDFHSLFCHGTSPLVAQNFQDSSSLFLLSSNFKSKLGLRSGMLRNMQLSYAQDEAARIFYVNGRENGVVVNNRSMPWPEDTYVGPETDRIFSGAPVGNHLCLHNSRMYIAAGSKIYWSEPYKYGLYEKARNGWSFGSKVLMMMSVTGGMFISDEYSTWFFGGKNPGVLDVINKVASYPALEWSGATDYLEGLEIGLQEPGLCAIWASPEGVCVGSPSGVMINLNKKKVVYPENVRRGAGLLRGYHFIHTMR